MIKSRNPLLVLIWSFGLYILMHTIQYAGCLVASLISGASFESIISGQFSNHLTILGQGATAAVVGVPFVLLITQLLWRRPWDWVRLHFDTKPLLLGTIAGVGLAALSLISVGLLGHIELTSTPDRFAAGELASIILGALGYTAFIAIAEEVIFRGMAIREWSVKWGWPAATVLGGLYFGVVHIIGLLPDLTFTGVIWIIIAALIGNLLFVTLYIRGDSLWLPIGFHFGWNLSLMTLFGVTMSGRDSAFGLFTFEISGASLITGGKFGVEASVAVMAISIIVALLILRSPKSKTSSLLESDIRPTNA